MIPPRLFVIYHFIVAIAMTIAGFAFMGFSIYGMVESRGSDLSILLFAGSFGIFLTGFLMSLLVSPRGAMRRSPKLVAILIFCMLAVTVIEIVIWAILMNDWKNFLRHCMLLEYPQSIITRWFDAHKIVVQIILFLGVPFQVFWSLSCYIIMVGHF
jgi:hypothetical protein